MSRRRWGSNSGRQIETRIRKYYFPNGAGEGDGYYHPGSGGITHPDPKYAKGKHANELARRFRPPMHVEPRTVTYKGQTWEVDNYDPRIDMRHRVMSDGTFQFDPAWWPHSVNSEHPRHPRLTDAGSRGCSRINSGVV